MKTITHIKCSKCNNTKPTNEFNIRKDSKTGYRNECKICLSAGKLKYNRTIQGLIKTIYHHQVLSCRQRNHPLPYYTVDELLSWIEKDFVFLLLYNNWKNLNYPKDIRPSIDRLDDYKTYSFDNIRICTWAENNTKAHHDRRNGINNKDSKAVLKYSLDGVFIEEYHSIREAARLVNGSDRNIGKCCQGDKKYKTAYGFKWAYKE